jgi:YEATS domain-containing protein 4
VTETGWGEFDVVIKVFINDVDFPDPITLRHHLRLFPGKNVTQPSKNTVVSETLDEIVFVDPNPILSQILNSSRPLVIGGAYKHETDCENLQSSSFFWNFGIFLGFLLEPIALGLTVALYRTVRACNFESHVNV